MVMAWQNEDPAGDVLFIVTYREDVPPDERTEAYMKQPSQQ
jgi:hypothetical protein